MARPLPAWHRAATSFSRRSQNGGGECPTHDVLFSKDPTVATRDGTVPKRCWPNPRTILLIADNCPAPFCERRLNVISASDYLTYV
jgi:hypothetical protein